MKRLVPTLIVTSYFAIDPHEIGGGIGERYVGLYGSFIKKFSKKYAISWYSCDDRVLREFDDKSNVIKSVQTTLPQVILSLTVEMFRPTRFRRPIVAIMAYPYAVHRRLEFMISLALLSFLSLFRAAVIIVDNVDPPIEAHVTWNDHIPLNLLLSLKTLETALMKLATRMIFLSESYKNYFSKKYKAAAHKFCVIPTGCLVGFISPKPPTTGDLTLLYSGSLYPVKDIARLIECVGKLQEQGLNLRLVLTGELGMTFERKPWIDYRGTEKNWLSWVKNVLEKADVGVLPYPNKVHWNLTHLAKVSDYMAAGKPVISTNLAETSRIFNKYECGLIANNWRHFGELIARLYEDRELAAKIGKAARKAAEEHLDYWKLAEKLENIVQPFAKVD